MLASAFGEHRVRLKLVSVVGKEVIELIHEEIDKEISGKSVNIAVRMLKPELDQFMKGLNKAVQVPAKTAGKAVVNKIHPTSGRQSIKTLIKQGQGVSSIPLADEGLRDFQKIAKKYGVDFAVVRDREKSPPVYTVFFKAKDTDAVTRILQDYSAKQIKKPSVAKVSVLEKLKKFKEIVAAMPKKIVEKKKERSL
ncbi:MULTISPECIES: PcfB family protein [Hungatella]|uniref:PcfB family protein n=1 Tax=Hungatella TaxID=1649459 RepID=UPI0026710429|nr:PcfB family protein [Hungatella hathewayi]MDD7419906.1 PcfB family protein [Ruminococcus sp.]